MKAFNKSVKVGTKVMLPGEYGYRTVTAINKGRFLIEVEGVAGSHQAGHIISYSNRANVEMFPALDDLYVSDAYGSVYERRDDCNMFVGKLNGLTLKQFVANLA